MSKQPFQWAVVGAGPAGIAAVGQLLERGILPQQILWLDPYFKVGDLGRYWSNVSSNTTVKLFLKFLQCLHAFRYSEAPVDFSLNHMESSGTCYLRDMVAPLQWITDQFKTMVEAVPMAVQSVTLFNGLWHLAATNDTFQAQKVILATGATPKILHYPEVETIPFTMAIDPEKLATYVNTEGTYAVFGSSHSAVLIMKYLMELGVQKIVNFYRAPCRYAINMGDWILFDNTGLKGQAAEWAKKNIDGVAPKNMVRYPSTEANIAKHLPTCDKAIYAVGFKPRKEVIIKGYEEAEYNPHNGIIAPGLFGVGIAYPQIIKDPFGSTEIQVGLWKFMTYLNRVIPLWLNYPENTAQVTTIKEHQ